MDREKNPKLFSRFIASLIDYAVIFCVTILVIFMYGEPNGQGGYTLTGLMVFVPVIFWFLYLIVIEMVLNATLGHYIMGLKVVKVNYDMVDFSDSLKRHLLDPLDFFLLGIPAIIAIKNTPLNQRLGDLWAGTIIVLEEKN